MSEPVQGVMKALYDAVEAAKAARAMCRDSPTVGALLSTLDAGEAAAFAHHTQQLTNGNLNANVDADNGTLSFTQ